jgi:hypothetical protein
MSATAEQVRTAVRALLRRGVDLNTTTERQIREELAQQLGSVEAHKKIIKVALRFGPTHDTGFRDNKACQWGTACHLAVPCCALPTAVTTCCA